MTSPDFLKILSDSINGRFLLWKAYSIGNWAQIVVRRAQDIIFMHASATAGSRPAAQEHEGQDGTYARAPGCWSPGSKSLREVRAYTQATLALICFNFAVPSRPVEVCYTMEKNESSGSFQLRLRWQVRNRLCKEHTVVEGKPFQKSSKDFSTHFPQDSNPCSPGSRVLAYQVNYKPEGNEQPPEIRNVTAMTDLLEVEPGNYNITVRAFNTAGYGPVAQLYIDTQRVNCKSQFIIFH